MIYTVTLNPAIDYVIQVDNFTVGEVNRTKYENMFYGGKGINVSSVLNTLGTKSVALGFIAGFTGQAIKKGLIAKGLDVDFVELKEGNSRINVKMKSDVETEINGNGPVISEEDINNFYNKLDQLKDGDVLILSGSIPKSLPDNMYDLILERVSNKDIRVVVDATNNLLVNALKHKPFLIKPNNFELGEIFNVEIGKDKDKVVTYARKLQEMGARNVLVSMAGEGAVLVDENNQVYKQSAFEGVVKNSVGAGDSMVAGFVYGYLKNNDYQEALTYGMVCGAATAYNEDLAPIDSINELLERANHED